MRVITIDVTLEMDLVEALSRTWSALEVGRDLLSREALIARKLSAIGMLEGIAEENDQVSPMKARRGYHEKALQDQLA